MDSNSQSNRTTLHRSIAAFVVTCAVIALWSGPAQGAPDNGTSKTAQYEQTAKPSQQIRVNGKAKNKSTRLRPTKKNIDQQSVAVPAARQTTGTISLGFDPRINGFSFANWADDPNNTSIGIDVLMRVFGQASVCARVIAGICDPYRSTTDFISKLRIALVNGRCDGLTVLASRFFRKQSSLSDFSPNATTVAELSVSQVDSEVVYWWATQVLPTFSKVSSETRTLLPSQFADRVAMDIRSGAGSTIGVYANGNGHSVLPIAIRFNGVLAEIDVYDSNTPGLTQTLIIDRDLESWVYVERNSSGLDGQTFSGNGSGGLDLVPLDARQSAPTNYFAWSDGVKPGK
jgi:hypothetical protein